MKVVNISIILDTAIIIIGHFSIMKILQMKILETFISINDDIIDGTTPPAPKIKTFLFERLIVCIFLPFNCLLRDCFELKWLKPGWRARILPFFVTFKRFVNDLFVLNTNYNKRLTNNNSGTELQAIPPPNKKKKRKNFSLKKNFSAF